MKNKILYLCAGLPPASAGTPIIALNLAQQFTRDEMILVGEKPYGRPPVRWDPAWPAIVHVQWQCPIARLRPLTSALQSPFVILACLWLVLRYRIRSIVVVFPRAHYLLIGYIVSKLTGARLYPYFHNTYYENRKGVWRVLAGSLQALLFRHATHIFVMSEGMSELYRRRYPGLRQSPLLHTFNEPLPEYAPPPAPGSPMRFVLSGSVNVSCWDAVIRLADAVEATPDAHLSILTGVDPQALRKSHVLRRDWTCEALSRDDLLPRLQAADVLLLPHGISSHQLSDEELLTIFPTKTIEYLLAGRPILAHTTPTSFITQFLRENDCALIVDQPDLAALKEAIARLRSDDELRCRLVRNALKAARRFQGAEVAAELRRRIA